MHVSNHFILFSLHPINYCAFALIISIAFSSYAPFWILAGLLVTVVMIFAIRRFSKMWFIALAVIYSAGFWRYQTCLETYRQFTQKLENKACTVNAEVTDIQCVYNGRTKQKIAIATRSFTLCDSTEYKDVKNIYLYLNKRVDLQIGDEIELYDFVLKPNSNQSYAQYLMKENIAATVFATDLHYTLIRRPQCSFAKTVHTFKQELLERCRKKLSPKTFSFFSSVFLGNKDHEKKLMEGPKDSCKVWGISHYLARSGLHMVIFIYLWHLFLNFLPLPFLAKEIILILIGLTYHLLSWPSISFLRALMSFLLFKTCSLLQLPSPLLHLLSLVTIAVLLDNPSQLFFLDFQLSFGLTCALAWFSRVTIQKSRTQAKY